MKKILARQRTEHNLALEEHFLLAEIFMALEKTGFNAYAARRDEFLITDAASALRLRRDLLEALCEFLAEKNILQKIKPGIFRTTGRFFSDQGPVPFLLAYKNVSESLAELMDGSKQYGAEVRRDARYLGTGTKLFFPELARILLRRGIKNVLDLGCGNGSFLSILAGAIPDFRGIGVEIDPLTAEEARQTITASDRRDSVRIITGDVGEPESFPRDTNEAEAITAIGILHEFRKDDSLIPLLNRYKVRFPSARLFLIEFDTPGWKELRQRPHAPERRSAAIYRFLHHFSEQGLPQSEAEWVETIKNTNWKIAGIHRGPARLVAFECQ